MTDPISENNLGQADYLQLFMQELSLQDPLKPVDNREFMAQMAQFALLQEAKSSTEALNKILGMNAGTQSLTLLGKKVRLQEGSAEGTVSKIVFAENQGPKLTVLLEAGEVSEIDLNQITEVRA